MKLTILAAVCMWAAGQQNLPGHKVLAPEQAKMQSEMARWKAQRDVLKAKTQQALSVEMAREKAGDCPNANSTIEQEECLGKEIKTTGENYAEFSGAIRHMLAGPSSVTPEEQDLARQRVEQFDKLEAESKKYRADASDAAYNEFKGGTLAPVFAGEVEQRLLRLHMQELAFIYGNELSNR